MRAPIGRVEGREQRIGREGILGQKSLALKGRVEEDDISKEDEGCPDGVRVCSPGSQWRSASSRRA